MTRLKNFFLFCSGIEHSILEKCPTDTNKYVGIGATVFFTGVLAFFSSGYALYTVFESYPLAIIFGTIWGLMIFNLDRYIVMSMKSYGNRWRDAMVAAPRLLLACLLAIVISKPLELKIFEKEINAELVTMEQEVFKNQEDRVKARYESEIKTQQLQIDTWKAEIVTKTAARDTLARIAQMEADGTGGSGRMNLGPIYRAKKADADNAQKELDSLLAINLPLINEKEAAIKAIMANSSTDINNLERGKYDGMAARIDAHSRLSANSDAIYYASIFILLLFIVIETAPIFVKLISYRSPYDYILHQQEHVFEMANKEQVSLLSNLTTNRVMYDTETGRYLVNARIAAQRELIDYKLNEKLEELKRRPFDWKIDQQMAMD